MLDKSIPYHNLLMRAEASAAAIVPPALPEGFQYRLYRAGDADAWAAIETSVGEFPDESAAQAYFARTYLPEEARAFQRVGFVAAPDGTPVATTSAWFDEKDGGYRPLVHWVAVRPEYQGLGLGRAAVSQAMALFSRLDPGLDIFLHTQTWSHKAVGLYLRMGFHPLRRDLWNPAYTLDEDALSVFRSALPPETWRLFLSMLRDE